MLGWCALMADAGGHLWAAAADGSRVLCFGGDGGVVASHALCEPIIALAPSSRAAFGLDRAGVVRELGVGEALAATSGTCLAVDEPAGRVFAGGAAGLVAFEGGETVWERRGEISALCLAADRRRLYVAEDATVTEVDPSSGAARLLAAIPGATLGSLSLAPGGLVGLDRGGLRLIGINLRHGTSTRIFDGDWANPVAVAYLRTRDRYVIAHADTRELTLVSRDGSTAQPLPLRYA